MNMVDSKRERSREKIVRYRDRERVTKRGRKGYKERWKRLQRHRVAYTHNR